MYPPPPPQQVPYGQLQLDLGFNPLLWTLYLVNPQISINGMVRMTKWGLQTIPLPAGMYDVEAWYQLLFTTAPGRIMVQIFPGQTTCVRYRPSWIRFLPGKMTLLGVMGALPPGPMGY